MAKYPIGTPYLLVGYINRDPFPYNLKDGQKSLKRLERMLIKDTTAWKFAYVLDPKLPSDNNIIHYYHPNTGAQQLGKDEYNALLKKNSISIYIVYTQAYKRKKRSHKGKSLKISHLEDLATYYNHNVDHILVYNQYGRVSHIYENGNLLIKKTCR